MSGVLGAGRWELGAGSGALGAGRWALGAASGRRGTGSDVSGAGGAAGRPVLEATDVRAGYGEVEILHGVSLTVMPGEIVSIIGPNGAGKSTFMKAVFGLLEVTDGTVRFDGREITNRSPDELVRRGMSYVPQTDNVFPSLTIEENLELGAFVREDGLAERMAEVYRLFPALAERPHERAGRLSGGQRQLLALARPLMLEPGLLMLDEPSASLAPKIVREVFEKVKEINRTGAAVLMVEQNAREALSISDRAYVMAVGEKRYEGAAQELLESEDVRRLYLGE